VAKIYTDELGRKVYDYLGQTFSATTAEPILKSEATSFSTNAGAEIIDRKKATFDFLSPQTPEQRAQAYQAAGVPLPLPPKMETPAPEPNRAIDGTIGQVFTFDEILKSPAGNDFTGFHQTADGKYIADETALARMGIVGTSSNKTPAQTQADTDLTNAKAERDAATTKLKNIDVSNDPALQQSLANISAQWNTRIADMERINKSREAAITTTGIRLGSRFTGGAGGMFGSIISEEERQGVSRIAGLEAQKHGALLSATSAYREQKWTEYAKFVDLAETKYKDQVAEVNKLNEAQVAQDKIIQERLKQERQAQRLSSLATAVANLKSQGIEDPATLLDYINTYQDGTQTGANLTAQELDEILDLYPAKKEPKEPNIPADIQKFKSFFPNTDITTPEGRLQYLKWQAQEAAAERKPDESQKIKPDTLVHMTLRTAGLTSDQIDSIDKGVRENGFDVVYKAEKDAGASEDKLKALQKAYGVKPIVTKADIEKDMRSLFTTKELHQMAEDFGYASAWTKADEDITRMFEEASQEQLIRKLAEYIK